MLPLRRVTDEKQCGGVLYLADPMDMTGPSGSTRYPSIEPATKGDRVLVVAPHMDDEAVGAGAYALDAIRAGADVFIAFLTAGDCARFSARLLSRRVMPT